MHAPHHASRHVRGFSVVELLIVIGIIVLLIAIIVPALGGARNAARTAATRTLVTDFANASTTFMNDNAGRAPGYFSQQDMASPDNLARGMSNAENVLLDLAGSGAIKGTVGNISPETSDAEVGPYATGNNANLIVTPGLIGAGDGDYFSPPAKFFVAQNPPSQVGQAGNTAAAGDPQMPDLVDAYGTPLLVWTADEFGPSTLDRATPFSSGAGNRVLVRDSYNPANPDETAVFYWQTNAAFLSSNSLGKEGTDYTLSPSGNGEASLIGSGSSVDDRLETLAAVLGHPSYYGLVAGTTDLQTAQASNIYPTQARGKIIVMSAGSDGLFLSNRDTGFARVAQTGTRTIYGNNYKLPNSTDRITDDDNAPINIDIAAGFDDLIMPAGN